MCTIQRYNLLAIVATCVFASSAAAADGDQSHAVLEHWVGKWTGNVAGADLPGTAHLATPDHAEAAWTLGDRFVQGTNFDSAEKPVGIWFMRYDADDEEYEVFFFAADGSVSEWDGTWSDADKTMNWEGEDQAGNDLSGYTKFANGKQEWKLEFEKDGETVTAQGTLQKQ